jgi:hypothetical protein
MIINEGAASDDVASEIPIHRARLTRVLYKKYLFLLWLVKFHKPPKSSLEVPKKGA